MALDKLVDGAQLDSDLGDIADAIRAKGGTSAELEFPQGFVDAVDAIPTGTTPTGTINIISNGTYDVTDKATAIVNVPGVTPTGTKQISITANGTTTEDVTNYASAEITVIVPSAGQYTAADFVDMNKPVGAIVSDVLMNSQYGWQYFLTNRKKITTVNLAKATVISMSFLYGSTVTKLVAPKATHLYSSCCRGCTSLTAVDVAATSIEAQSFYGATNLNLIVLRSSTVATMANANVLTNTKFMSGGAGGTIYIPKALYDQLGTGTNDYKAASNWSTYDGYGTITWKPIEGSIYETQYVDGTPIPTA